MATEPTPQRAYRAACPNCGAPVDFQSAASAFAVCSFCRSTVVRDGDALRRIGESAELFDDHSPLQLGVSGVHEGEPFTLVGRLQYRYDGGTWNEWHALFGNGRSGWLSEDNGAYVVGFEAPLGGPAPAPDRLNVGTSHLLAGRSWVVASITTVTLNAVQGELPRPPRATGPFTVVDLRNPAGEVATLDYADPAAPVWWTGRGVALSELRLRGLAESKEKTLGTRRVECPNCGAALTVTLATTQSIVCHQCKAVVDLSAGTQTVGTDLAFYKQGQTGREPLIPLGRSGDIALGGPVRTWQVVGYTERVVVGEPERWREYLLYHRVQGFVFLVDAEDGWGWAAPITGTPQVHGDHATYEKVRYRRTFSYTSRVGYVLGEFYWKLERGQTCEHVDHRGPGRRQLNREETATAGAQEVTWSAGESLEASAVAAAFRVPIARPDASPVAKVSGGLMAHLFFWAFLVVFMLVLFKCDGDDGCDDFRNTYGASSLEYRNCVANTRSGSGSGSHGSSYGGFSSGGSHK